ncbi:MULTISPECIES: phenylalanine--tRNA ligase subunit alpha [Paeniglutamicibacter]|uniref:Phenylalanine--tRNA ligase alpha subunit n=1 Tax=Paeniglutamicibacter sulfureus TaxID=43666 RepID=A0ABU2BEV5_9MICC|nr:MULTISPECIES: phenylalanine--tRNA ligase subunit alpha [Paeniglutamicibacter]MCV9994978.1 phenylalanine--tRNA ligase subunit alpha [Paeniglutamicibacter sp. ZC-3]MDR7357145.1 phenylalanyl-tRNA synthetase alpha chain [Paeniglutamicibacter sulfureus]
MSEPTSPEVDVIDSHAPVVPHPTDEAGIDIAVQAALAAFAAAKNLDELKAARLAHTGEKSPLSLANREIGRLDKSEKAVAGKLLGASRGRVNKALAGRTAVLEAEDAARILVEETVDVTAAPRRRRAGARHPLSTLQDRVSDIFVGMGWEIAEGPEIESEWFNFDALNFAPDHPAREMQDTFFIEPADSHLLLRTHTSPVQVRSMLERELPIYVLCPGRVYRTDELDATHTPVFHQFEGLAIDKNLTMADLRGTLEHFARQMFGEDASIRLRPNFFPFTEPSAELDIWHPGAKGGPRWIEWGGCGMVNPNVLRAAGIDPEEYSGFAFGMGVERTLMFRNEVPDMHDMIEGDIRFSEHFGMEI